MNDKRANPSGQDSKPTLQLPDTHPEKLHASTREQLDANIDLGSVFGNYEILGIIAKGGMGAVFRARQSTINRVVALKVILAGDLADTETVQRFFKEAEAAARLDHPGIVPVYEFGEYRGRHFYSMAYLPNGTLSERVTEQPLAEAKAVELVKEIAIAVDYAHKQGVLHRDLKPSNILLDQDFKPKIADFGLARTVDMGSELTETGQILGTPSYMSPEQAVGNTKLVDESSDIYSLGALLYCLVTGRPPFQAASRVDTILQVRSSSPVPLRQLNGKLSMELNTICMKCLEKEKANRYATAGELADDLSALLENRPIRAKPIGLIRSYLRWYTGSQEAAIQAAGGYLMITGVIFTLWNLLGVFMAPIHERLSESLAATWFQIVASLVLWSIPSTVFGYLTLQRRKWGLILGFLFTLYGLGLAFCFFFVPESTPVVEHPFDPLAGFLVITGCLGVILYGLAVYSFLNNLRTAR